MKEDSLDALDALKAHYANNFIQQKDKWFLDTLNKYGFSEVEESDREKWAKDNNITMEKKLGDPWLNLVKDGKIIGGWYDEPEISISDDGKVSFTTKCW